MNLNLNGLVANIKQIFALVAVAAGVIVCLKVFGIRIDGIPGSLMDWAAVSIATSLASK